MIRHLVRLIWHRKRTNALVIAELFVSFLVLFAVLAFAVYLVTAWNKPVGFAWDRVWDVEIDVGVSSDDNLTVEALGRAAPEGAQPVTPPEFETMRLLRQTTAELPEVEATSASMMAPYEFGSMVRGFTFRGQDIEFGANEVDDRYPAVIGVSLADGRWFGPEDDGQTYDPVVINRALAERMFPGGRAVGQVLNPADGQPAGEEARRDERIVGVVSHYREDGEFDGQAGWALFRKNLEAPRVRHDRLPRHLLLKVRPGTTAAFEERLVKHLQSLAPDWSFEVRTLAQMRDSSLRFTLAPLAAMGLVAAFLMAMVALGLLGVLWQNVTQRTREMGLRRAKGATRVGIKRQVLGEVVVMTSIAVLAGAAVVVQLPLLNVFYWVETRVYVIGLAMAAAAIYLLAVLCGWYPARIATAVEPADALRYE